MICFTWFYVWYKSRVIHWEWTYILFIFIYFIIMVIWNEPTTKVMYRFEFFFENYCLPIKLSLIYKRLFVWIKANKYKQIISVAIKRPLLSPAVIKHVNSCTFQLPPFRGCTIKLTVSGSKDRRAVRPVQNYRKIRYSLDATRSNQFNLRSLIASFHSPDCQVRFICTFYVNEGEQIQAQKSIK